MRCMQRFHRKLGSISCFSNCVENVTTRDLCADKQKHECVNNFIKNVDLNAFLVDVEAYANVLRACCHLKALEQLQYVHSHITKSKHAKNLYLINLLIHAYGKCGYPRGARELFEGTSSKNVVSWTAMMSAAAQNGQSMQALELFRLMQKEDVQPNKITVVTALAACCSSRALADGKHIHALSRKLGFELDVVVATSLVKMYSRCGSLEKANQVFHQMPERNVISWTTMISAYVQHGQHEEALSLFEQMQIAGSRPNKVTYLSILNACASLVAPTRGKLVHAHMLDTGCDVDVVLGTAVVDMYGKCGSLEDALRTFNEMSERNVVTWTALIAAYARNGCNKEAMHFFEKMQVEGFKPNNVTVVTLLTACSNAAASEDGMLIHAWIVGNGTSPSTIVSTALVDMYGKCGYVSSAREIFDLMPERDMVTWNSMISVYSQNGQAENAFLTFQQMQLEGVHPEKITFVSILDACTCRKVPVDGIVMHHHIKCIGLDRDVVVGTALVNMYGNCGKLVEAHRVFDMLSERNVVAWTAIISAYAQNEQCMEAIQLFYEMRSQGVKPNRVTFLSVLDACTFMVSLEEGERIHLCLDCTGLETDVLVGTSLVHMYRKCGCLLIARQVFDKVLHRNLIIWTSIIAAYAQLGDGKEVLQLFGHMQWQGVKPDEITLVSLLSACSHTGLIDEGCHFFFSLSRNVSKRPTMESYGCMIDLYGRAGKLDKAELFIKSMPTKPDTVMLMALLGACRTHQDVPRGKRIGKELLELDPANEPAYVILSNLCAASGRWEDADIVRCMMNGRNTHESRYV